MIKILVLNIAVIAPLTAWSQPFQTIPDVWTNSSPPHVANDILENIVPPLGEVECRNAREATYRRYSCAQIFALVMAEPLGAALHCGATTERLQPYRDALNAVLKKLSVNRIDELVSRTVLEIAIIDTGKALVAAKEKSPDCKNIVSIFENAERYLKLR